MKNKLHTFLSTGKTGFVLSEPWQSWLSGGLARVAFCLDFLSTLGHFYLWWLVCSLKWYFCPQLKFQGGEKIFNPEYTHSCPASGKDSLAWVREAPWGVVWVSLAHLHASVWDWERRGPPKAGWGLSGNSQMGVCQWELTVLPGGLRITSKSAHQLLSAYTRLGIQ